VSKAAIVFQSLVNERGKRLRRAAFQELKQLANAPAEYIIVDSRSAIITIIVQPSQASGGIRVVVQGRMKKRLFGWLVSVDGFYKYPNGTLAPLTREDLLEFDQL